MLQFVRQQTGQALTWSSPCVSNSKGISNTTSFWPVVAATLCRNLSRCTATRGCTMLSSFMMPSCNGLKVLHDTTEACLICASSTPHRQPQMVPKAACLQLHCQEKRDCMMMRYVPLHSSDVKTAVIAEATVVNNATRKRVSHRPYCLPTFRVQFMHSLHTSAQPSSVPLSKAMLYESKLLAHLVSIPERNAVFDKHLRNCAFAHACKLHSVAVQVSRLL